MRLTFPVHRLSGPARSLALAAGALLLLGTGSASATFPGNNGPIVATKCEDGGSCLVEHLYTVDPGSGAEQQLTSGTDDEDEPSFSPDGSRMVFEHCPTGPGFCHIGRIDANGANRIDLTSASTNDGYPSYSWDGSRITFTRWVNNIRHVFAMNADGSNVTPLTSGPADDYSPVFSPDGTSIVFNRYESGIGNRIYKIPAGGGAPVQLSSGSSDLQPSFSPDGAHILFTRSHTIWIMDADGGNEHALTTPAADTGDSDAVFSSDGTQIAFERYSNAAPYTSPLMVMNADGSNQHAITGASEYLSKPDWESIHPVAPTATPPSPQVAASNLTLIAPKKESIRKGRVYLFATSSQAGTGLASGKVSVPKLAKTYRLRPASKALSASIRTKITLKLPRKTLRAARAALAHRERVNATLVVRIKDSAGNVTSRQLRILLIK